MTVELHFEDYIDSFWFAEEAGLGNIVATIVCAKGASEWCCSARLRVYVDDKIYGSEDLKHSVHRVFTFSTDEEKEAARLQARASTQEIYQKMGLDNKLEITEVQGDTSELLEKLKNCPWFHARPASPDEIQAYREEIN